MSLPRRSGKRRRSSSGSDSFSFSGDGDSCVSPQLLCRPVLSPPPGLGRGRRLAGTGTRTAGPTRPRAAGDGTPTLRLRWARRIAGVCIPAPELDGQRAAIQHPALDSNIGDRFPLGRQHAQLISALAHHCLRRYGHLWFLGLYNFPETTSKLARSCHHVEGLLRIMSSSTTSYWGSTRLQAVLNPEQSWKTFILFPQNVSLVLVCFIFETWACSRSG